MRVPGAKQVDVNAHGLLLNNTLFICCHCFMSVMDYCVFTSPLEPESINDLNLCKEVSHAHAEGSAYPPVSFSINLHNSVAHWSVALSVWSDLDYLPAAEILGTVLSNGVWTFLRSSVMGALYPTLPSHTLNQQLLRCISGVLELLTGSPPRGSHFYKYACSWVYLFLVQDVLLSGFRVESWKEALTEVKWEKPALARASGIKEKGCGFSQNM